MSAADLIPSLIHQATNQILRTNFLGIPQMFRLHLRIWKAKELLVRAPSRPIRMPVTSVIAVATVPLNVPPGSFTSRMLRMIWLQRFIVMSRILTLVMMIVGTLRIKFPSYIKCSDRSCKIIFDNGNCTNVIPANNLSRLVLTLVPHLKPYRVSWVYSTSIPVTQRCLVPIQMFTYKDHFWCDVVPMDVGHIILGRAWIYNFDVSNFVCANICVFNFQDRKVKLHPLPERTRVVRRKVRWKQAVVLRALSLTTYIFWVLESSMKIRGENW